MKNYILILLISLNLIASPVFASGTETEEITPTETTNTEVVEQNTVQIDENTTKVTNKYFDLVLIKKSQSAFGQYVPYELQITPHIDSAKTQILWSGPNTLSIAPGHKEFMSMVKGQTYKVKANVTPLRQGTYDITVSAISWQYDTNYTNAASDTLTFDKGLVLQPTSVIYQVMNVIKYLLILVAFGLLCWLVVKLAQKYSKQAKQWLTPPF